MDKGKMELKTTLKNIEPFYMDDAWIELLEGLGEDPYDPDLDRQVSLKFILENNGLADALRVTRRIPEIVPSIIWYIIWCAERVRHLMIDERSTNALDITRRYLEGKATREEIEHAGAEAWDALSAAWEAREATPHAISDEEWIIEKNVTWVAAFISLKAASEVTTLWAIIAWDNGMRVAWEAECVASGKKSEPKDQTEEFLRLIDCLESGIEYTI